MRTTSMRTWYASGWLAFFHDNLPTSQEKLTELSAMTGFWTSFGCGMFESVNAVVFQPLKVSWK